MYDKRFFYGNGEELKKGDKVLVGKQYIAQVDELFMPGTPEAMDFACALTGGFRLTSQATGCEVWYDTDEDLELLERS